jgi:hypothetical protein
MVIGMVSIFYAFITAPTLAGADLFYFFGFFFLFLNPLLRFVAHNLRTISRAEIYFGFFLRLLSLAFCEHFVEQYSWRRTGMNGALHSEHARNRS